MVRRTSNHRISPALDPLASPSSSKQSRLRLRRQAVPDDADGSEIGGRYLHDTPLGVRRLIGALFDARGAAVLCRSTPRSEPHGLRLSVGPLEGRPVSSIQR